MAMMRTIIRRDTQGHEAPVIPPEAGSELCWDTRDHQGRPPTPVPRDTGREEEDTWMPERQAPVPAPFLRQRQDADFGGRVAQKMQLHDVRESAVTAGAVADPAAGHTFFLTVAAGGTVTLVPPATARAEVPEPGWNLVDSRPPRPVPPPASGARSPATAPAATGDVPSHELAEAAPQPFATPAAATTGMTVFLTVTGAGNTVTLDGAPARLPGGGSSLIVSGDGRTDVFSAIWHPVRMAYLIVPGPMGYNAA